MILSTVTFAAFDVLITYLIRTLLLFITFSRIDLFTKWPSVASLPLYQAWAKVGFFVWAALILAGALLGDIGLGVVAGLFCMCLPKTSKFYALRDSR